jgi:hypothetical protein
VLRIEGEEAVRARHLHLGAQGQIPPEVRGEPGGQEADDEAKDVGVFGPGGDGVAAPDVTPGLVLAHRQGHELTGAEGDPRGIHELASDVHHAIGDGLALHEAH